MYYIYIKEIKGDFMATQKNTSEHRIRSIIKYNTLRKYFGDWNPKEFNACYRSERPVLFRLGVLSVDDICDTLWNEMSYNPVRFGTKNPFEFDGKNSLEKFITTPIAPDNNAFGILSIVQSHLSRFWALATKYDETFAATHRFKNNCVTITTSFSATPYSKPVPSTTYVMIAPLRESIKQIAMQNLSDFGQKAYQQQMIDTVLQRHPDLVRPIKIQNFAAISRQNKKLQEYKKNEKNLIDAIWDKNFEITDTQSRINTLNTEFENPGDTTKDTILLELQTKELEKLEHTLATVQQRIKQFTK